MKRLDFDPEKSKDEFHRNYQLHDKAEFAGKNLLVQWGIEFRSFGQDSRYSKVWEKGKDKPDLIVSFNSKEAFLDWKGKNSPSFIMNKRAAESYLKWSSKYNIPILICFFVFDNWGTIKDRRIASFNKHKWIERKQKEWDKNYTIEFVDELPRFTKSNLISYIDA